MIKRNSLCFFIIAVTVVFVLKSTTVTAQQIPLSKLYIRHITQKDGLLFNSIKCFLQDNQKYIWMGGKALQRFDGYRFKNYFTGKEQIITESLFEDSDRRLWAGTSAGMFKLNRNDDRFELFQDSIIINGKKQLLVATKILQDCNKRLWIASLKYYAFLNTATGKFEDASLQIGFNYESDADFINCDSKGNIWFRYPPPYGIRRYNCKTGNVTSHFNNPLHEAVFDLPFGNCNVIADNDENVWISESWAHQRLLYRYNQKEKKLFTYSLHYPPGWIGSSVPGKFIIDNNDAVWIQLEERWGIIRFDRKKNSFEYLFTNESDPRSINDTYSSTNPSDAFYKDEDGNFWYGGNGVSFFSPYNQPFQVYRLSEDKKKDSSRNEIVNNSTPNSFLNMPDGNLYIGYYGDGLWQFNNKTDALSKINLPQGFNTGLWNLFSADGENIYVTNQLHKAAVYNIKTHKARLLGKNEFPDPLVTNSYAENPETVWLCHWGEGITKYNTRNNAAVNYKKIFLPDFPENKTVWDIQPEGNGFLWLAPKERGLQLFEKKSGTIIKTYFPEPGKLPGAGYNDIRFIERLNDDTLLLSSTSGFIILNTRNMKSTRLTMEDGLPDNSCMSSITEKNKKYTWINTHDKGLCRLNLETLQIISYRNDAGVENLYGDQANIIMNDGRFVFANLNSFIVFDPQHFTNEVPQAVFITGLSINNSSVNIDSLIAPGKKLRLADKSSMSFDFSALDFSRTNNLIYYVQLLNADTGWINIGNQSHIEYRNLPPGNYLLRLKCSNENGVFSKEITEFAFYIIPPFWQRWWFYALCAVLIAATIYILYRYRIKTIRHEAEIKAQYNQLVAETEIKALRSQMNPHFIFNSLNAINRYILKSDKQQASAYLTKFSKLIRLILDNSRQTKIPLSQELNAIELYLELESLRFQNNFDYKIIMDEGISSSSVFVPPMIIQPFVENAIWHGLLPKGNDCSLEIRFHSNGSKLICIIEDNGIGRKKSAELKAEQVIDKSSIGISATEQRLQLITQANKKNASVTVEDLYDVQGNATGTRVVIHIPYSYN